nr:glycosyltransferase family 2 protein [uncultured Pedobacter sp.]
MKTPFFSIIIPTFNSDKVLRKAISGIVNQTYNNYEILIIDGLSTDNTLDIAQSFGNENIRIYSEKDRGIYDAMNKGVRLAKGEWLYFMGSDDSFYAPNTLKEVSKNLAGVDVVYGDVFSTRFEGRYDGEFDQEKIVQKNICHQAIFFKKAVFDTIGCFDIRYSSHADWEHNLRWFLSKTIKKVYINLVIANYADGGFSSTNGDVLFSNIKNWKVALLRKTEIPFFDKLIILKSELAKALFTGRKRDFLTILITSPKFLT